MASLKLFVDVRSTDSDGKGSVKIRLSHNHSSIVIETGVSCRTDQWNGSNFRPIRERSKADRLANDRIEEIVREYDDAIYKLKKTGRIRTMRPADIRAHVCNKELLYKSDLDFFEFAEIVKKEKNAVTAGHMDDMVRWMRKMVGKRKALPFEDITLKWLNEFTAYMSTHSDFKWKEGLSTSTQGIILRNIKMVYNKAIAEGFALRENYPFDGFKMPRSNIRKEFFMPDEIRKIRDAEFERGSRLDMARDYLMLSLYLCGTNFADLWEIDKVDNGYITYKRQKTKDRVLETIRMKIQPEALRIMQKRRGRSSILDCQEHYLTYESFYHSMKHGLDKMADQLGISKITTYMARYTWATFAGHENVPEYVIDRSLGHTPTTLAGRHYISYDWRKTDRANRLVIDYISSNRPWEEDVEW